MNVPREDRKRRVELVSVEEYLIWKQLDNLELGEPPDDVCFVIILPAPVDRPRPSAVAVGPTESQIVNMLFRREMESLDRQAHGKAPRSER